MEIVELIDEYDAVCISCKEQARVKRILLKCTKPHTIISQLSCPNCGYNETHEEDCEELDYGIEITCDFTNKKNLDDNIRRMVFLGRNAKIDFYDSKGKKLFDSSSSGSFIDTIEGIIMFYEENMSSGLNNETENTLTPILNRLKKFKKKSGGLKLVITDKTGYSRVCPINKEYTEIQHISIEDLNDMSSDVFHKKI